MTVEREVSLIVTRLGPCLLLLLSLRCSHALLPENEKAVERASQANLLERRRCLKWTHRSSRFFCIAALRFMGWIQLLRDERFFTDSDLRSFIFFMASGVGGRCHCCCLAAERAVWTDVMRYGGHTRDLAGCADFCGVFCGGFRDEF